MGQLTQEKESNMPISNTTEITEVDLLAIALLSRSKDLGAFYGYVRHGRIEENDSNSEINTETGT